MNEQLNRVVVNSVSKPVSNIISGEKLKEIQQKVLNDLKEAIIHSMGPAGSNSLILRGNSDADIVAEYSKDGNKIIKNIKYQYPIEMAIKSEIENATRRIEKEVGDGTSSVVVMSSLIFDGLIKYGEENKIKNPYYIMREFKKAVDMVSDKIRSMGHECTLDDIYNIALISTNGNEDVASQIYDIYKEYGMGVFIDVSASVDDKTYIKSYNGVTIEAGYSDPCMINNVEKNDCIIRGYKGRHPIRIYHFADPIDTPEQLALFQKIIETNIINPSMAHSREEPTVILAPTISRDAQAYMRRIVQIMHNWTEDKYASKPRLLIVTNYAGLDENYVDHISTLCDCKPIKKYIDDAIREQDQKSGLAPTLDNVVDFYGTADEVEADMNVTKFVNPALMYAVDDSGKIIYDDDDNPVRSNVYENIVNFLEAQYSSLKSQGGNVGALGSLKRQLNAVKSNMVELFIGGISISDRDSLRDLVEDAVLNTRSAAQYGVGYGANTMGYCATTELINDPYNGITAETEDMLRIIHDAYKETITALYSTVFSPDDEEWNGLFNHIEESHGVPYNISKKDTGKDPYDGSVLTSIESEPMILDTISKIVTIMYTANQTILQAPSLASHY